VSYQPQKITAPDGTALIVIAEADYLALLDAADIAAADRARAESDFTVPAAVVDAMIDGKSPLAAWREYRGLTQLELATKAQMQQPAIARIESRNSRLRADTLAKLAAALDVPAWALQDAD
jgi:DNA-binding Xre family transcriptional regulator